MERILQSTAATISVTFTVDGTPTDPTPATASVGITRADGTVLVAPGAGTTHGTAGVFTFVLTTTHTALLDTLTVAWTTANLGTITTYVEVVGGFLFTIAEARAVPPLNDATKYSTAKIIEKRTEVEEALEDECGVAFVPRYVRETINGPGSLDVLLRPYTRTIRSATIAGTALTAPELADLTYVATGSVYGYSWTAGYGNIVIGYEHGMDRPKGYMKRAALLLAKSWLVAGPVDDRASTFSSADGGTYGLVVEGRGGSPFGIPAVDAACQRASLRAGVA